MKVKNLIEQLNNFDEDLDIILLTEDESFVDENQLFKLLDISDINVADAERSRDEDRRPALTIGQTTTSSKYVIIELTGDF